MAGNYEQRDNSGTLGINDRKEKDTHPDYRGQALIDGVGYWISGWIKTRHSDGSEFLSLAFQPKEEAPRRQSAPPSQRAGFSRPAFNPAPAPEKKAPKQQSFDDMDDDIPF